MSVPKKLQLKRAEKLTIIWEDDSQSVIPIQLLRKHCPCATCRELREKMAKTRLVVIADTGDGPLSVADAKLIGQYALNITWTDGHASGIYSFAFLKTLGTS